MPQIMVGRVGVEPTTSRLSGVRSNHLSYRPLAPEPTPLGPQAAMKASSGIHPPKQVFSRMKGHEDGGKCSLEWRKLFWIQDPALSANFLRKEVIQPQVPLRLPCYDFTPVAKPTVVACLPYGLAQRLRVNPTPMV